MGRRIAIAVACALAGILLASVAWSAGGAPAGSGGGGGGGGGTAESRQASEPTASRAYEKIAAERYERGRRYTGPS